MKWHSKEVVFLVFSVLTLAVAAFGFAFGPKQIPIWYSLPISEQQIDQKLFLFVFPVSCILIVVVHSFFIRLTKQIDMTMGRIVLWASLIPLSILSIALIHILVITL
jgi:hypothetical protein